MSTTRRTISVNTPVNDVAAYLSDFSTTAEWDPHTVSCRQLDDGPITVGTRFENVQRLAGRRSTLTYTVTDFDAGRRVVLEGGGKTVRTRDEMVFGRTARGGSLVTYIVDVRLNGVARIGRPLVPVVMKKIADEGAAGMRARLAAL